VCECVCATYEIIVGSVKWNGYYYNVIYFLNIKRFAHVFYVSY